MPRKCGWCRHPQRERLEKRVLGGEPFRAVASEMGLSVAACSRHWRLHVRPQLKASVPDVHLSTFARRLLDIADDAADLRQSPDARVKLAAMRTEREALAELSGRLGFDDTEAVEDLAFMTQAIKAVAVALLEVDPAITESIAELLDAHHDDNLSELAQVFRDNLRDRQQQLITTRSTRTEIT